MRRLTLYTVGLGGTAADAVPASYVLRARFSDGHTQTVHIRNERAVVGAAECDVVVDEPGVSGEHAELLFRGGIVGIRDLGSTNGTWVCGRRVDRAVLKPGRWFRIGRARFELVAVRPASDELWDVRGGIGSNSSVVDVAVVAEKRVAFTPVQQRGKRPPPPPRRRRAETDEPPTTIHQPARAANASPAGKAPARGRPAAAPAQPAQPAQQEIHSVVPTPVHSPAATPAGVGATTLVAEADVSTAAWLARALSCPVVMSGREVLEAVGASTRTVVVVGRKLLDMTPDALVAALGEQTLRDKVTIVAAEGVAPRCDRVFYRLRAGLQPQHLAAIVRSAAKPNDGGVVVPMTQTRAWASKHVFDVCAAVGQRPDPAAAAAAIQDGIGRLMPVSRCSCVFYDADSGLMWTESTDAPIEGLALSGIVGFVARTGGCVHAPVAASDPRFDRTVDDPNGSGREALVAVPAISPNGEVHAVLVAVREPTQGGFEPRACETLALLGRELGPVLHRIGKVVGAQEVLEQQPGNAAMQLFRPEAIEARQEQHDEGDVIRVSPRWNERMYWALLAMLILSVIGVTIGEVTQYSTGACIVRQEGRSEVYAAGPGSLASVDVEAGMRVAKGQVLARLDDGSERATYDATRNDFHAQLRNRLLDPNDDAAASQAQALRRQLEAAEAALEQRVVRAPHNGIVTDIAVDPGQHLKLGDAVMAVVDDSVSELEVVAFLPGGDSPQIEPGMTMRVELSGFDYAYQDLEVEEITEGVVGPNEAARILGPQLADTLPIGGGVVMVRGRLPSTTFESDGETYPYHDGMGGTAEVRLRDETVLEMLFPALREF